MNDKTLFVVAAGLSTRFNGQPKHLAQVNGHSVIVNTLTMAKRHYRDIWVVLNEKANSPIVDMTNGLAKALGVQTLLIPSGKGDADAVYQAIVKSKCFDKHVSVCWGDTWFTDETIFETAARRLDDSRSMPYVFDAMCAYEDHPYGWFDIDKDNQISKCTFVSELAGIDYLEDLYDLKKHLDKKCHDQCFFNIDVGNFKRLYEAYLPAIEKQAKEMSQLASKMSCMFKLTVKYEVSWYKMVNWALKQPTLADSIPRSIVTVINKAVAKSFNTEEELMEIEKNA